MTLCILTFTLKWFQDLSGETKDLIQRIVSPGLLIRGEDPISQCRAPRFTIEHQQLRTIEHAQLRCDIVLSQWES
jgi:hypothetical protein